MASVIVDSTLRSKLLGLGLKLELWDESGRVMAHVTPVTTGGEYEPSEPRVSREELRRVNSNERRFPTSEVLQHVELL